MRCVLGGYLVRLIRLCLLIVFCLAWPISSHAQDRAQITRGITYALTDIALIERERARADVPDDFAGEELARSRQRLAENYANADRTGQGRAIRQEAQRQANRTIGATLRTDYLRSYPDPQRVRADLAAAGGDVSDAALAGRQAGRVAMLANSLDGLLSNTAEARRPADVTQLRARYWLHFHDIRARIEPTLTDSCPRWQFWCRTRQQAFNTARGSYEHDLARVQEAAALYFPESFRERFVDSTGVGGSRAGHKEYQAQLRAEREAQENAKKQAAQRDSPNIYPIVLLVIVGLMGVIGFLMKVVGSKEGQSRMSGNYGTADYASPLDAKFDDGVFKGVFLGPAAHPGIPKSYFAPVMSTPESHTLVVAPSGTGKGTSVILPTLLLYKSSLITIDPKGENAAITARYRREQLGHTVHIVNPWGLHEALYQGRGFGRASFNPLDVLDPKAPNIVGIANSIAVTICHQTATNDAFWQNSATAMLAGILLWVADAQDAKRAPKTLAHVADIVSGGEKAEDLRRTLFPRMVASSSYRGAMRKLVGRFVQMDDKTYSGVIAQLSQSLQFLADDQIATATDHSSFDLPDLVNGRTTLYIVIPDDQMQAQAIWLKLIVNAVTQTFKRYRPAAQDVRGMFLIDEFPVLGRVDGIVTDIALVRGAGLDVTLIVQGLDQLRSIYGTSADTIIANCGYKWFCNIKDLQTAEYISKALGQMTVRTVSQTISGADGSTGRTLGEAGRALLFPDEIMSMGKGVAFAFQARGRPFYVKPIDYWHLHAYFTPHENDTGAPKMPDLRAYDDNPFHRQNHYNQDGEKEAAQPSGKMDRAEALAMFGLEEGASDDQVRDVYKNLMAKIHPDKGGTTYLAQKLNEARDLLLGKKK